jgi:tetratricopeptide (TPR) repeat protein
VVGADTEGRVVMAAVEGGRAAVLTRLRGSVAALALAADSDGVPVVVAADGLGYVYVHALRFPDEGAVAARPVGALTFALGRPGGDRQPVAVTGDEHGRLTVYRLRDAASAAAADLGGPVEGIWLTEDDAGQPVALAATGPGDLHVVRLDGAGSRVIGRWAGTVVEDRGFVVEGLRATRTSWSTAVEFAADAEGRRIAVTGDAAGVVRASRLDGGGTAVLAERPFPVTAVAVGVDDDGVARVVFGDQTGRRWVVRVDGSGARELGDPPPPLAPKPVVRYIDVVRLHGREVALLRTGMADFSTMVEVQWVDEPVAYRPMVDSTLFGQPLTAVTHPDNIVALDVVVMGPEQTLLFTADAAGNVAATHLEAMLRLEAQTAFVTEPVAVAPEATQPGFAVHRSPVPPERFVLTTIEDSGAGWTNVARFEHGWIELASTSLVALNTMQPDAAHLWDGTVLHLRSTDGGRLVGWDLEVVPARPFAPSAEEGEPDTAETMALAGELRRYSRTYISLGQPPAALEAARQAVALLRPLPPAPDTTEALGLALLALHAALPPSDPAGTEAVAESVDRLRGLVPARPSLGWELAMALNVLALDHETAGRLEEAVAAEREVVDLLEPIERDTNVLMGRATALDNLATYLHLLGRREEGRAAGGAATLAWRAAVAHASDHPQLVRRLALSLDAHAGHLAAEGRVDDEIAVLREAVEVRRGLAETQGEVSRLELAVRLGRLAGALSRAAQPAPQWLPILDEAVQLADDVVSWQVMQLGLDRSADTATVQTAAKVLAPLAESLASSRAGTGEYAAAAAAAELATGARRGLAANDPSARPAYWASLQQLTQYLLFAERRDDALTTADHMVALSRELDQPIMLAIAHAMRAECLLELGSAGDLPDERRAAVRADLVATAAAAVAAYQPPDGDVPHWDLVTTVLHQAEVFERAGLPAEAAAAARFAADEARRYRTAATDRLAYADILRRAAGYGRAFGADPARALRDAEEAVAVLDGVDADDPRVRLVHAIAWMTLALARHDAGLAAAARTAADRALAAYRPGDGGADHASISASLQRARDEVYGRSAAAPSTQED